MQPDIWFLDGEQQHSPQDQSNTADGGADVTTTGQSDEWGPVMAAIESSNWTEQDVAMALELAQTAAYLLLAYYAIKEAR